MRTWLINIWLIIGALSFIGELSAQVHYQQISLKDSKFDLSAIETIISKTLDIDVMLIKNHRVSAQDGSHVTYRINYGDIPIFNHYVYVHHINETSHTIRFPSPDLSQLKRQFDVQSSQFTSYAPQWLTSIWHDQLEWFITDTNAIVVEVAQGASDNGAMELIVYADGSLHSMRSLSTRNKDSVGSGLVFNPDPLTLTDSDYGIQITDRDDATSSELDSLRSIATFPIRQDVDGNWALESNHSIAIDTTVPITGVPKSLNGHFKYSRDDNYFEYVNAHFHINELRNRLSELGFDSLANYQIRWDAHASELDQSFFDPISFDRGWIGFGDGGVDDAEDADVIIHEYGHALVYSAAPGSNVGEERNALDEGFCDYLAFTYSKALSDTQNTRIFNWDGHNEFWSGRVINDQRTYPSYLEFNLYLDAPIFSSAMAEAHSHLGPDITDELYITSLYSYFIDMTMSDAAELVLLADSILYQQQHQEILENIFCARGLLKSCADTLVNSKPLVNPYLGNTQRFIKEDARLYLYPNSNNITAWRLYDIGGNLLIRNVIESNQNSFHILEIQGLKPGIYALLVESDNGNFVFKVLKN